MPPGLSLIEVSALDGIILLLKDRGPHTQVNTLYDFTIHITMCTEGVLGQRYLKGNYENP